MTEAAGLLDELLDNVVRPLLIGGEVRPLEPVGEALAVEAVSGTVSSSVAWVDVQIARETEARKLCAIDTLPALSRDEWLLLFAFNDLLQATNATLTGTFGSSRPDTLLSMARALIARASAPATIGEALARHATFARLMAPERIDTRVAWWTGSETFRGCEPPKRLLYWRGLRRVTTNEERVRLQHMAADTDFNDAWLRTLNLLLRATPLTDLASADRAEPAFGWTGAALSLIRLDAGHTLALRTLERTGRAPAIAAALGQAAQDIAVPEAVPVAEALVHSLNALPTVRTA